MAAGNERARRARGFTLLELMVVLTLIAIVTAGAVLALRDAPEAALEREGSRLAALLDSARAQSRASGLGLVWLADDEGFAFYQATAQSGDAQAPAAMLGPHVSWLDPQVRALPGAPVLLGPEPIIEARSITLALEGRTLTLGSDGLRPFLVTPQPADGGVADAAGP